MVLRPWQITFCGERPQGGRMIGVIEQGLREIEHILTLVKPSKWPDSQWVIAAGRI